MKNTILKVVAVAAITLSYAFSWVNSSAYAQVVPSLPKEIVQDIAGDAKTGLNFRSLENNLVEKSEAEVQALKKKNADADARAAAVAKAREVLQDVTGMFVNRNMDDNAD